MRTTVEIQAPASAAWELLITTSRWVEWGPSVIRVESAGRQIGAGSTGRVKTVFGVWLPFRITDFVDGRCWGWEIAGIPATRHQVEPLGPGHCRLTFEVPLLAAPYLIICRVAVLRIKNMLEQGHPNVLSSSCKRGQA